ncbi:MAG: chromosome segregation protein SMC [Gallionella sp.]
MTAKLRLSQIKLAGFKSFVDPTHIHLPGQIVGVVGPNGCGKSNVIDALRWVLGESRAAALRGASMQDVIFNGSDKRKAVARASVELIFDNSLGKAGGQWARFAEISIKRVLQRNGESNYLINNQKVRRRDITDIFLGTGLGARAYAIVEQGMISRIIEAKPEELRVFLEEAAGVSTYRDRRRETAQRLADTRDNLLRIGDILQEMENQLTHLQTQAEVATQYRKLEVSRDTTQQLLWLVKKQAADAQRASFATHILGARTELEAQTAVLRERESRLETLRSQHDVLSDVLNTRQGELYSANAEMVRIEQQLKDSAQQQLRITQQIDSATRQIEQQQQQHRQAISQFEHGQNQQEEAAYKRLEAEQNAALEEVRLPQAETAARTALAHYSTQQREQLLSQQKLQLAQTQHDNLLRHVQQLESRLSRLTLEQANLPRPDKATRQLTQESLVECEMAHQAIVENLASLQAQLPTAEQDRQKRRATLQIQERQFAQTDARLHALQQLQRRLDSDKNLKAWLQLHQLDEQPRLWRSIRISSGWESALESVLHERLNALSLNGAVLLDVPPDRLALFSPEKLKLSVPGVSEGVLTPLLSYVECQDAVLAAMCEWLASVYAVADLSQAYKLRAQLPQGGCFVTPDGHIVGVYSVLFYAPDSQFHGVLSRQREIEQLALARDEYEQGLTLAREHLNEAEQHYQVIERQLSPLRNRGYGLKQQLHELQIQRLKLEQAHERSTERALQMALEIQEVQAQLTIEQDQRLEIMSPIASLREAHANFQAQLDEAQAQVDIHECALREHRERTRQRQHDLQEANFFSRTCVDKVADFQVNIQLIVDALSHSKLAMTQLQTALSGSKDEQAADLLQAALRVQHDAESALVQARINLEAATAELQQVEPQRMMCEHQLTALREKLNAHVLKEQEARLYYEQWAGYLQDIDESVLLPLLSEAKPNKMQGELSRLNKAIEDLGAVNLAALDELKAATERKLYLDAQSQDLREAMATLETAIKHIDRESRDLLMETYHQVNQHLSELFPVLFAGGEARLVLTGEEIFDSGVQVMAQPPGKKNSTIHLLSGGEKALTAIALIFSLFQLNPAPFCLLDEVDAPLDDINTERLCTLVKKMAQHTQFVFISHNKITMEMAHQLIGVTMQEKGVSKVVSVDIEAALRMTDEVA